MLRDFFHGFVKIHILHHAAHEPIYGAAMMRELARHGYQISPGTLYPMLHSLEKDGYLSRHDELVSGRWRKCFTATAKGRRALTEAKIKVLELTAELTEGHSS